MSRILLLSLVLAGSLAAGCSPVPRRTADDAAAIRAYEARRGVLAPLDRWEITGRLAITDGKEGGSGALNWIQDGGRTRMKFRGTLGQGSWQLEADDDGAMLLLADGRRFDAPDVSRLVRAQIGWNVPVVALYWWVRGLAADTPIQERRLDASGRMTRLRQSGWEVEFGNYREWLPAELPSRLFARRGDYAVKLIVKDWRIGSTEPTP